MSYKMPSRPPSSDRIFGKAKIKFSDDKVLILFKLDKKEGDADTEPIKIALARSDCPDTVREGMWLVSISKNRDKLYTLRPIEGVFEMHFLDIAREKDKAPVPKMNQKFNYLYFNPIFEITSDAAKGLTVGYRFGLHYNFEGIEDENHHMITRYSTPLSPRATNTLKLDEFLNAIGVLDFGPIPYSNNILPDIWHRAKKADKKFQGVIKDGSIDSLIVSNLKEESFG